MRTVGQRIVLVALLASIAMFSSSDGAEAETAESANCTHEEALTMGKILHDELDFGSKRWTDRSLSKTDKDELIEALVALMSASDFALRGEDGEACRRYRAIARSMDIEVE